MDSPSWDRYNEAVLKELQKSRQIQEAKVEGDKGSSKSVFDSIVESVRKAIESVTKSQAN